MSMVFKKTNPSNPLDHYKPSVHILGQTAFLKPDVLTSFEQVQDMTRHDKGAILNVCCPYISCEEITHSLREIVWDGRKGRIRSGRYQ
jgi:ditrans,polycis-polyprenyl diphosphate synthase